MKKIVIFVIAAFMVAGKSEAVWEFSGIAGVDYSETSVSDNWTGGETDARSWNLKSDAAAKKVFKKSELSNMLKLEYGKSTIKDQSETEKSDLIDFDSVYSREIIGKVDVYGAFRTDSQFTEFFNPALLSESAGFGVSLIKSPKQNLKFKNGLSLRQNLITGESTVTELGAEAITNYDFKFNQSVKFLSELKIFTAFKAKSSARLDSTLYIKLNKYLTADISYLVINNSLPGTDFFETAATRFTTGIALSYNLF